MQIFYSVRQGDTIYSIAKKWSLPIESIVAANKLLSPDKMYVGQQLSIPPGVNVIRTRTGDTVFSIAQFFGVPPTVIMEANQLRQPYILQVGDLIKVPPGVPYYVVQQGDTLYTIGSQFNVCTKGLVNTELIRIVNSLPTNSIFPGDRLVIPYAPSGDPGLIAYTSKHGMNYDISLLIPSTGVSRQLTFGLGESFSVPFWSPDSRRIAFVGKHNILYVICVNTGSIALIDQFSDGLGKFLNWSPNSQAIVYTKQNEIILYSVITHGIQRLKQPNATDVHWFPNGKYLLYQAPNQSGISQLFSIRTDGTDKRQITDNKGGLLNHVRLSPNGLYALYTTPGASISLIYTVEIATGKVFEVRGGPLSKNYYPSWSPDSSTIAYSATAFEDVVYFSLIKTVSKHGHNDQIIAISNCFATPVTWSHDNRKVAYLSGCNHQGTASELWLIEVSSPVPIRMLVGKSITSIQWSPKPTSLLKNTYTNIVYKVQFQYPAQWKKVTDERCEGQDGFFQISAITGGSIQSVCKNKAYHQLMPYGTTPRVNITQIQGQEACMILPSEDQPLEMRKQAALIVRYPMPVQIEGTKYKYFILWVDKENLNEISITLTFL